LKRVVVDPNVLLSALIGNPEAAPAILLEAIHDHAVEMVACPMLIAEVRENLTEPYFRALLDQGEAEQAVTALERVAVMRDDPVNPEPVLRDSSDDYLCSRSRDRRKPR
jgi:putative PIN family toxin of toxin-antitoxin system